MILDFTTTAMPRPEILEATYASFTTRLKGVDFRRCTLHINLDPLPLKCPAMERARMQCLGIASEYFGEVHVSLPGTASFPAAVKWCWTQPQSDFFFHLEDDWELTTEIHIGDLLLRMEDESISCVNLRAYWFETFRDRICLSPALWRSADALLIAKRLSLAANPEQQLRPATPALGINEHGGKHQGFHAMQYPVADVKVIKDIGRDWLNRSPFQKEVPATFTRWSEK